MRNNTLLLLRQQSTRDSEKKNTFLQVLSMSGLSKCIFLFLQLYVKALSRRDGAKEKFLIARSQAGRLQPKRIWRWAPLVPFLNEEHLLSLPVDHFLNKYTSFATPTYHIRHALDHESITIFILLFNRSRPGLGAACAEVQSPVAHPPPDLLLICDSTVRVKSTILMSS